jgi:hypothetical protein
MNMNLCDYCAQHQYGHEMTMVVISPEVGPVESYWMCDKCAKEAHL